MAWAAVWWNIHRHQRCILLCHSLFHLLRFYVSPQHVQSCLPTSLAHMLPAHQKSAGEITAIFSYTTSCCPGMMSTVLEQDHWCSDFWPVHLMHFSKWKSMKMRQHWWGIDMVQPCWVQWLSAQQCTWMENCLFNAFPLDGLVASWQCCFRCWAQKEQCKNSLRFHLLSSPVDSVFVYLRLQQLPILLLHRWWWHGLLFGGIFIDIRGAYCFATHCFIS